MTHIYGDRVKETTTSIGTGAKTLLGAVTGYDSFANAGTAGMVTGDTCYVTVVLGSDWETSLSTYNSTGPTLTPTTVYESSNGNAAVNFPAGTKDVFLTGPASRVVQKDASGTVTVSTGTLTASTPVLDLAQTWNSAGTTFTGLKFNITDTASASASRMVDVQVGGTSKFSVGNASGVATIYAGSFSISDVGSNQAVLGNGFFVGSGFCEVFNTQLTFSASYGGRDLHLRRIAAATLQQGAADAAAPVAQTTQVQSVVAGTTNTAGQTWTLKGSAGTGTGAGGDILFRTAPAGSSGTAQNSYVDALRIGNKGIQLSGGGITVSQLPAAASYPGYRFTVTDAVAQSAFGPVAGGGALRVDVLSDGSAWNAHPTSAAISITNAVLTVDFGSGYGARSKTFDVAMTGALTSNNVWASVSNTMPSGVSEDELEMDPLTVSGRVVSTNTVRLTVATSSGPITGQRNINVALL